MKSRFLASRRQVLEFLGSTLVSTAIGAAAASASVGTRPAGLDLTLAARRLFAHRASAAVIGAHYLAQFDEESSAQALEEAIRQGMPASGKRVDEQSLLARIQKDFEHGDVVKLQGWMLSRTEARLCALLSL
jgi:hypothetical protein